MANQLAIHEAIKDAIDNGASTEQILSWIAEAFEDSDLEEAGAEVRDVAERFDADDFIRD